jgi:hypothetical protein
MMQDTLWELRMSVHLEIHKYMYLHLSMRRETHRSYLFLSVRGVLWARWVPELDHASRSHIFLFKTMGLESEFHRIRTISLSVFQCISWDISTHFLSFYRTLSIAEKHFLADIGWTMNSGRISVIGRCRFVHEV